MGIKTSLFCLFQSELWWSGFRNYSYEASCFQVLFYGNCVPTDRTVKFVADSFFYGLGQLHKWQRFFFKDREDFFPNDLVLCERDSYATLSFRMKSLDFLFGLIQSSARKRNPNNQLVQ